MRFSKSNLRRYHKQFKMAATARYFVTKEEYLYFHSYMADYFLGTYGGGVCKPFRYTEVEYENWKLDPIWNKCNMFKGAKSRK